MSIFAEAAKAFADEHAEVYRLRDENERLRSTLERIAEGGDGRQLPAHRMRMLARKALRGEVTA